MRKCDATGKLVLSQFSPDSPYKAYFHEAWYGNDWNGTDFGRDYDFDKPFFVQFAELLKEVPLLTTNVVGLQNCDYQNQCGWSKNCYLTIESDNNQDSLYGYRIFFNNTVMDCTEMVHSERCYECTDCENCFQMKYSQLCEQCSDSAFLFDCRSCSFCFGCTGLRQKKYCIFNDQLTEEQYKEQMAMFDFSNRQHLDMARSQWEKLRSAQVRKAMIGEQNDNVTGNYIFESKDCFDCFGARACRDCRYCHLIRDTKDAHDFFCFGEKSEKIYESECCGGNLNNLRFCVDCFDGVYALTYCYECVQSSHHCFGCIGLKKQEYCILNKQYSPPEYESLMEKIMKHMQSTGEWGEFFPSSISPFSYNESVAQEYFPMEKESVIRKGWQWRDHLPFTTGKETIRWSDIPEDIDAVPDSIVEQVLACTVSGKNYRITKQELVLYRQLRIPIPMLHPDERHRRRMALRNPRTMYERACMKCGTAIQTTYAPDRPETVYCEECYLKEVY